MSDATPMTAPEAGWYPDRNEVNLVRWWDGQQWTDQTRSTAPAAAAFEQPAWTPPAEITPVAVAARSIAPGWYPDSNDPSLQRWWDGSQWTAHTNPTYAGAATRPAARGNTMATLSLIFSIVSFAGLIIVALLPLALAAVIVGIAALRRIPMYAAGAGRRGQAIAGIVLGAVSLILTVFLIVVAIAAYEKVHPPVGSQAGTYQSSPGMVCDPAASTEQGSSFRCDVGIPDRPAGVVTMVQPGGYDLSLIQLPGDSRNGADGSSAPDAQPDPDLSNS
jgi:hypothetical protein